MTKLFDPIIEIQTKHSELPEKYLWVKEIRVMTPYYVSNIGKINNFGYVSITNMRDKIFVGKGVLKQDGVLITNLTWRYLLNNDRFQDIYEDPILFEKFVIFLMNNTDDVGLLNENIVHRDQKVENHCDWREMTQNGTIWMYGNGSKNKDRMKNRIDIIVEYFVKNVLRKQKQKDLHFMHNVRFTNEVDNDNSVCTGTTKRGIQCKKMALKGQRFCHIHMSNDFVMKD